MWNGVGITDQEIDGFQSLPQESASPDAETQVYGYPHEDRRLDYGIHQDGRKQIPEEPVG